MKSYLHLYAWADTLIEVGQKNEVGTQMIAKIKEVIREAYKAGFKDGRKSIAHELPPRGGRPSGGVRR